MKRLKHPLLPRLLALLMALCLLTPAALAEEAPAAAPLAAVPDTPAGTTACEVGGFVFFVPVGWTEVGPEDSAETAMPKLLRQFRGDEDGPALTVACIDLSGREDLTSASFIGGILLAAAMGTPEDEEPPAAAAVSLRGVTGVLATDPASGGLIWMGQHGSAVIMAGITGAGCDPAEIRALLFRALGVAEDEVVFTDPA